MRQNHSSQQPVFMWRHRVEIRLFWDNQLSFEIRVHNLQEKQVSKQFMFLSDLGEVTNTEPILHFLYNFKILIHA